MNVINQLFFAVLISSVTSTLLFGIWYACKNFFMRVNPKMIYTTLRWVCIMYLLPVGYVAIILTNRSWIFFWKSKDWRLVFARTEITTVVLCMIAAIWFVLACALFIYRLVDNMIWCRKLEDNIPEEDEEVIRIFRKVCASLGMKESGLKLFRNVLVTTPMIVGIRNPKVVLPERDYTPEDLEMIFYHELSHRLHGDLGCKVLAIVAMIIHCFNPIVQLLLGEVNLWSECMADVSALEASGNLHHAKLYFDNILRLVPDGKNSERERFLFSTLSQDESVLAKRIDFMKEYQKSKTSGTILTAVEAVAFVGLSISMAFMAGAKVADFHKLLFKNTEERIVKTRVVAEDGTVEHYCKEKALDTENLHVESMLDQNIVPTDRDICYAVFWEVDSNSRYIGGEYDAYEGQQIYVSLIAEPQGKECWAGIIDDEGNACYVAGKNIITHAFKITENHKYRVFVQNNYQDDTKLSLSGSVTYSTP